MTPRTPRLGSALAAAVMAAALALQALSPAQALVIRGGAIKGGAKGAGVAGAAAAHPHVRVDAPELLRPAGGTAGESAAEAAAAATAGTASATGKPWPGAPHLRVRMTGQAQRDAVLLQALNHELAVAIHPERVRAGSLADDALTDEALVNALGPRHGSAEHRFMRFLREGPPAPGVTALARELGPLRGHTLLLLAHVDAAQAALSFRGAGGRLRLVPIVRLEAAARQAGVQLLVVGCDSAQHASVGFAGALNSLQAAHTVLRAMQARPASVFDLFAALSSEHMPLILDAARFKAERTVELVLADGRTQSTLHWLGPSTTGPALPGGDTAAPAAQATGDAWGLPLGLVLGATLLSLLIGARLVWRHVSSRRQRWVWCLADTTGHVLLLPWLLSALAESVAGAEALWWAWGAALLLPAAAAGVWWLGRSGGGRGDAVLSRWIALRVALVALPFAAVAALHAGVALPPAATAVLMALYQLGRPLPDPGDAALAACTVGFLALVLHDGWERGREALAEGRRRRGQRALHRQQLQACGVTGRALRRALATRHAFEAECRHPLNGGIRWNRQHTVTTFTAGDPWAGGPPRPWLMLAVPVATAGVVAAAQRAPAPTMAYGLTRLNTAGFHPLPQILVRRWQAGQLAAESLPGLLAQVEPRLRGIDFLNRQPRRWVFAFVLVTGALSVLLFAAAALWGMQPGSEGRQAGLSAAAVMGVLFVVAPLSMLLRHRLQRAWLQQVQAPAPRQRHNGSTPTASPGAAT